MAGLAYMTGPPGQPLRAGASVIDILGGVFGVVAVLAALQERARTGRGQLVRSALFESTVFLVGQRMAGRAMTGEEPPPMPARRGAWAIYQTFATADGEQLFLGITSNNHFRAFCERRREPYTRRTAQMLQTGWIETLSPCLFGFVRRLSRSGLS